MERAVWNAWPLAVHDVIVRRARELRRQVLAVGGVVARQALHVAESGRRGVQGSSNAEDIDTGMINRIQEEKMKRGDVAL